MQSSNKRWIHSFLSTSFLLPSCSISCLLSLVSLSLSLVNQRDFPAAGCSDVSVFSFISCFSSSFLCLISPSLLSFSPWTGFLVFLPLTPSHTQYFTLFCSRPYLRLFPPLLEAGFGVLVETIWQWTVPSSNMSQMAPNTSVAGIPWGWGMVRYRTAAATENQAFNTLETEEFSYIIKVIVVVCSFLWSKRFFFFWRGSNLDPNILHLNKFAVGLSVQGLLFSFTWISNTIAPKCEVHIAMILYEEESEISSCWNVLKVEWTLVWKVLMWGSEQERRRVRERERRKQSAFVRAEKGIVM